MKTGNIVGLNLKLNTFFLCDEPFEIRKKRISKHLYYEAAGVRVGTFNMFTSKVPQTTS